MALQSNLCEIGINTDVKLTICHVLKHLLVVGFDLGWLCNTLHPSICDPVVWSCGDCCEFSGDSSNGSYNNSDKRGDGCREGCDVWWGAACDIPILISLALQTVSSWSSIWLPSDSFSASCMSGILTPSSVLGPVREGLLYLIALVDR